MSINPSSSRRRFLFTAGIAAVGSALPGAAARTSALAAAVPQATSNANPDQILSSLLEGNKHFVSGEITHPRRKL